MKSIKKYFKNFNSYLNTDELGYLILFVNGDCNLSCRGCCSAAWNLRKDRDELSVLDLNKSLQGINKLLHVTITGGEPFLRDDLDQLIKAVIDRTGVSRISINTNGTFSQKGYAILTDLLSSYPETEFFVSVSIDGTRDVHDKIRNKKGSYDLALEFVYMLNKLKRNFSNLTIRIASLLHKLNLENLEDFIDNDLKKMNVDFYEIIFPRDTSIDTSELLEKYKYLTAFISNQGLDKKIFSFIRSEIIENIQEPKTKNCLAGEKFVEIYPNGDVVGCEMNKVKESSTIGNIGENLLVDILSGEKNKEFRKIARECECSFECSLVCDLVFKKSNWRYLLYEK